MPRKKSPQFGGLIIQPRTPGQTRQKVSSAFSEKLERAVQAEMAHWGVSRSFVMSTSTAYALGVEDESDYRMVAAERKGTNLKGFRRKRRA